MRALLLGALVGRLPLGSWEVNAAVCRPTKGTGNIWRLAGTQTEGLPASTAFEALAHAVVGDGEVTLCKIKLLEGSLHSVRLHAVALGHPVAGDLIYHGASRAFAGHPEVSFESERRMRLLKLHRQLLFQSRSEEENQPPEPLMLLPWLVCGEWSQLNMWEVHSEPSATETKVSVWRKHLDELSPLLELPSLGREVGLPSGHSTPCKCVPKATSPSRPGTRSPVYKGTCVCWKKAATRTGLNLWRKFH